MKNKAKWTFAVYLAGDNNLSNAGERDLAEMRRVGSSPEVNVVAEFDRSGPACETIRYHIQKKGLNERTEPLGEPDCGDPKVLLQFIRWVAREFPAEHYALILWNHGGGWEPSEIDRIAKKVKATGYGKAEGSQRSHSVLGRTLFRSTLKEILSPPNVSEGGICSDDGTGHSLDTVERVCVQCIQRFPIPLGLVLLLSLIEPQQIRIQQDNSHRTVADNASRRFQLREAPLKVSLPFVSEIEVFVISEDGLETNTLCPQRINKLVNPNPLLGV